MAVAEVVAEVGVEEGVEVGGSSDEGGGGGTNVASTTSDAASGVAALAPGSIFAACFSSSTGATICTSDSTSMAVHAMLRNISRRHILLLLSRKSS